ncbi:hypothetical protein [Pseudomonas aeruginosa]|uniref:hypothetical protein n=1 Tax=Pseudomonas aeruginosa TaxID=287 RepID=UPI002D7B1DDF|nr:hypothetical protein [Pseudomonas aeruginosa]HEQ2037080.1 hypothetical protein [Pseudomonas aeruginosa]
MKFENKLEITTVKYWKDRLGKPKKSSIAELIGVNLNYAHKVKKEIIERNFNLKHVSNELWKANDYSVWVSGNYIIKSKDKEEIVYYATPYNESYIADTKIKFEKYCTENEFTEITREEYLVERKRVGESIGRWKAHEREFDKKKENELSFDTLFFLNLMMLLILLHYFMSGTLKFPF